MAGCPLLPKPAGTHRLPAPNQLQQDKFRSTPALRSSSYDDGQPFGLSGPADLAEISNVTPDIPVEKEYRRQRVVVEALTFSVTARCVRNRLTSGSAISTGERSWWKRRNRATQWPYACSVLRK